VSVASAGEWDAALAGADDKELVVAYFWADFHEACKPDGQMDQVTKLLASRYATVGFVKVSAEQVSQVAEKLGVSMVPAFAILRKGVKVDLVEGANPASLQSAIDRNLAGAAAPKPASSAADREALDDKLRRLIQSAHVVLFMKGTAAAPKCKFSRAMVELLGEQGLRFVTFDILSDNEVREGLKTYSNWSTYPQLYIGGKLVGGVDKVKELVEKNALKPLLAEKIAVPRAPRQAPAAPPTAGAVVDDAFLEKLTKQAPVMLFMKGNPDAPACGFSSKIVQLLNAHEIKFSSFDILENEQVRAKLKVFANWPTYPQLWVNGKLIGGLDIVQEMAEDDDLAEQLGIEPLNVRLEKLIKQAPVMLFMKGDPENPRCGFSRKIVDILQQDAIPFQHFDILEDEEVRQGLKTFSNWPTYPQLYAKGKLVGGLDIINELREEDELKDALQV